MADTPANLEAQLAAAFKRIGVDVGYLMKSVGNPNELESISQTDLVSAVVSMYQQGTGGVTLEMVNTMITNGFGDPFHDYLPDYLAGITIGSGDPQ